MQSDLAGFAVMKRENREGEEYTVTLRNCWGEMKLNSYLECQDVASGPSLCAAL